jgi:hypothetical protein
VAMTWIDAGATHLDPGAYTASVLLPRGTTLEHVEVAPPCVMPIEPPGGWKAPAVLLSETPRSRWCRRSTSNPSCRRRTPPRARRLAVPHGGRRLARRGRGPRCRSRSRAGRAARAPSSSSICPKRGSTRSPPSDSRARARAGRPTPA